MKARVMSDEARDAMMLDLFSDFNESAAERVMPNCSARRQTMTDLLKLAQDAIRRGGSAQGMSFWEQAAACGVRAHAIRMKREAERELPAVIPEPYAPGRRLNALTVGTLYHLLHEVNADPSFVWDAQDCVFTGELIEALRLYRAFREQCGTVRMQLADEEGNLPTLTYEVPLEAPKVLFGGQLVTGRMDCLAIYPNDSMLIVDFKTAAKGGDKYSDTLQAAAYIAMLKLQYPHRDVLGMQFLQVVKGAQPEFNLYMREPRLDDLDRVQKIVAQGTLNLVGHGRCNTLEERKQFGGCRCTKSAAQEEKENVAAEELLATLTLQLTNGE